MAQAGYSGTPLPKKLGLKAGQRVCFLGLPATLSYQQDIDGFAAVFSQRSDTAEKLDYLHVFETSRHALEAIAPTLRGAINPDGMIWISWPKKASRVPTSITEDVLREVLLPTGLVDVKVCAVDDVWSGLKFMVRKELRAG